MKKNFKSFFNGHLATWYWICIGITILIWNGCSLVGFGIGSAIKQNPTTTLKGWQSQKIIEGQEISLVLKDQRQLKGKYAGMDSIPFKAYNSAYEIQKNNLSQTIILPSLNDTVFIKLKTENSIPPVEFRYLFAGFDMNDILLRSMNETAIIHAPYAMIESMRDKSNQISNGAKLQVIAQAGIFPSLFNIKLNTNGTLRSIQTKDILQVSMKAKPSTASTIGFVVGLGIDLVILATLLNPPAKQQASQARFSCPYIYSYDGHQYHLDGETYGGAIFKSAQRTDLDNLDYLKENKGTYRLKLTNELQETQYTDEFKLMVIDHPIGSKVMPAFNGELYAMNTLAPPIKAIDQNGCDVLDLVKTKDEKIWLSNPFNRNPEIKKDGRDAMILEFKKPANATTVKLAFNVQNTDWAAYLQGHVLSLHGNKLDEWYALMNSSKAAQAMFKQVMIREGMLLIQLWDGKTWVTRDYVWEVGPSVAKDQVIKLDLSNYSEQNLRIRLETTVGFWMINRVEADYSQDILFHTTTLSAVRATDQDGNDLIGILKDTDEKYYVQPTDHDWAEIIFKAIPEIKNTTRSFILKCNGYYTIHTNNSGDPQQDLLNKLITEPGAYGQYTLRMLNQNMAESFKDTNYK